jgi:hypothetical protein
MIEFGILCSYPLAAAVPHGPISQHVGLRLGGATSTRQPLRADFKAAALAANDQNGAGDFL